MFICHFLLCFPIRDFGHFSVLFPLGMTHGVGGLKFTGPLNA